MEEEGTTKLSKMKVRGKRAMTRVLRREARLSRGSSIGGRVGDLLIVPLR
jgi:hypothetical protein